MNVLIPSIQFMLSAQGFDKHSFISTTGTKVVQFKDHIYNKFQKTEAKKPNSSIQSGQRKWMFV